jgi:uncharacterized protein
MSLLKIAAGVVAFTLVVGVLLLLFFQASLIYYPRPYDRTALSDLEQRKGKRLAFGTSQGSQTAFYLPPRADSQLEPAFLWIVCGGNGSIALDYAGEPLHWDARFGYLFVDYPGYGLCEGNPTPESIQENIMAAAAALRKELAWTEDKFRQCTGAFGHSIGCAAALMAADALQLKVAVLCSPFTTLTEMGRRVLGWPLCCLNRHRFDNVAHLRALDTRGAAVRIFHGTDDEVIPTAMSRQMHELFPKTVRLKEVSGGRHNDVVMRARKEIGGAMRELALIP